MHFLFQFKKLDPLILSWICYLFMNMASFGAVFAYYVPVSHELVHPLVDRLWQQHFVKGTDISKYTSSTIQWNTREYKMKALTSWPEALIHCILISFATAEFPWVPACVSKVILKSPAYGINLSLDYMYDQRTQ
jgi:hypothetical protein